MNDNSKKNVEDKSKKYVDYLPERRYKKEGATLFHLSKTNLRILLFLFYVIVILVITAIVLHFVGYDIFTK